MVATRSAASSTRPGVGRVDRDAVRSASTGCGRAQHGQDRARSAAPASPTLVEDERSPDVVVDGREVDLDAELGRRPGQVALQRDGGVPSGTCSSAVIT